MAGVSRVDIIPNPVDRWGMLRRAIKRGLYRLTLAIRLLHLSVDFTL